MSTPSSDTNIHHQSPLEWLRSDDVRRWSALHADFETACREDAGFNLFLLISDTYYRENFHSDVIKNLLSPAAPHGHGEQFLRLFLEFLNRAHHSQINPSDYQNAVVTREQGHIDVLIRDQVSRKSIVIENKINGASDMEDQLPRYLKTAKSRWNCECDAIVYLTLNQVKEPDKSTWNAADHKEVSQRLLSICAVGQQKGEDLLTGWLTPCLELARNQSQNQPEDLVALEPALVIHQYQQLLLHLGRSLMNTELMAEFYQKVSQDPALLESGRTVSLLLDYLPAFRANRFHDLVIGRVSPFSKVWVYKDTTVVIQGLPTDPKYNSFIKIHIDCSSHDQTIICFWDNRGDSEPIGRVPTLILNEIGMMDHFNPDHRPLFVKNFKFPDEEEQVIPFLREQFLPKLEAYCQSA